MASFGLDGAKRTNTLRRITEKKKTKPVTETLLSIQSVERVIRCSEYHVEKLSKNAKKELKNRSESSECMSALATTLIDYSGQLRGLPYSDISQQWSKTASQIHTAGQIIQNLDGLQKMMTTQLDGRVLEPLQSLQKEIQNTTKTEKLQARTNETLELSEEQQQQQDAQNLQNLRHLAALSEFQIVSGITQYFATLQDHYKNALHIIQRVLPELQKYEDSRRQAYENFAKNYEIQGSKVFGVELETVIKRENSAVPFVVILSVRYLRDHLREVGLLRLSGSKIQIDTFKRHINGGLLYGRTFSPGQSSANPFQSADPHVVSGLLKLYFREMPDPLLTFDLYDEFIALGNAYENYSNEEPKKMVGFQAESPKMVISEVMLDHSASSASSVSTEEIVQKGREEEGKSGEKSTEEPEKSDEKSTENSVAENSTEKSEEKAEEKSEEKAEEKSEEKAEEKSEEKAEEKSEKLEEKVEEKLEEKSEEKSTEDSTETPKETSTEHSSAEHSSTEKSSEISEKPTEEEDKSTQESTTEKPTENSTENSETTEKSPEQLANGTVQTEKDEDEIKTLPASLLQQADNLVGKLPEQNREVLLYLLSFFRELAAQSGENKMDYSNIALVIAPTILYGRQSSQPTSNTMATEISMTASMSTTSETSNISYGKKAVEALLLGAPSLSYRVDVAEIEKKSEESAALMCEATSANLQREKEKAMESSKPEEVPKTEAPRASGISLPEEEEIKRTRGRSIISTTTNSSRSSVDETPQSPANRHEEKSGGKIAKAFKGFKSTLRGKNKREEEGEEQVSASEPATPREKTNEEREKISFFGTLRMKKSPGPFRSTEDLPARSSPPKESHSGPSSLSQFPTHSKRTEMSPSPPIASPLPVKTTPPTSPEPEKTTFEEKKRSRKYPTYVTRDLTEISVGFRAFSTKGLKQMAAAALSNTKRERSTSTSTNLPSTPHASVIQPSPVEQPSQAETEPEPLKLASPVFSPSDEELKRSLSSFEPSVHVDRMMSRQCTRFRPSGKDKNICVSCSVNREQHWVPTSHRDNASPTMTEEEDQHEHQ
ncbi:hypothetical protein PROFUN_04957 [Planoprotostelium fungivorum]|uniref:Rho-GAP domain-containing protein n=1 Tax=Planoprotostelium fungivorum TaxID=1890364 RepID=A0A2P6NSN5_9EUKA|nr:hypothetical protein PROFUN_04957 [Planoprotostelium fungivorum]